MLGRGAIGGQQMIWPLLARSKESVSRKTTALVREQGELCCIRRCVCVYESAVREGG